LSLVLSGGVQCGVPCISKNRHKKKKEKAAATGKKRDTAKKKAAHDKKKAKIGKSGDANDDQATCGPNYVPDEDEAIAMAFVAASEDGIDAMGKKTAQAAVMEALRDRFPKIAADPIKCHLCQRVNGHKCKTDGCFGTLCSLCNFGSVNEHEYICHSCRPILALSLRLITSGEEL
jgi:hypothetical protein